MRRLLIFITLLATLLGGCSSSTSTPLQDGRTVYGNRCSSCHGASGQGGVGPALTGVVETWPTCAEHIEWVTLGSDGWREVHGDTHGANDKPVEGGMPGHEDSLSAEEIAAVAAWERVTYGGVAEDVALADCGVVSAAG